MKSFIESILGKLLIIAMTVTIVVLAPSCKEEIAPEIKVYAGYDQLEVENYGYQVNIKGTPLENGQSGRWRLAQGINGTFDDPESHETVFRGEPGRLYTLEWEIRQGDNYKTDWMNVSFKALQPVIHNDLPDTLSETYTVHLEAEEPKFGAEGVWRFDGEADGLLADSTSAITTFIGQPNEHYNLKWILQYGEASEYNELNVVFDSLYADAGEDNLRMMAQTERLLYSLEGHLQEGAQGNWSIIAGAGGKIFLPDNPNSLFEGLKDEVYVLTWEVTHGNQYAIDTVRLRFGSQHGFWQDSRDGQEYRTLKVGKLEWLAENYNYAYDPGYGSVYYGLLSEAIVTDGVPLTEEAQRKRYGRLYTYQAAMESVPEGWRMPTERDWNNLIELNGGYAFGAELLREGGESGMDLVMGGGRTAYYFTGDIEFWGQDGIGYYWCLNEWGDPWTSFTPFVNFAAQPAIAIGPINPPDYGLSVRYVRDVE